MLIKALKKLTGERKYDYMILTKSGSKYTVTCRVGRWGHPVWKIYMGFTHKFCLALKKEGEKVFFLFEHIDPAKQDVRKLFIGRNLYFDASMHAQPSVFSQHTSPVKDISEIKHI